MKSHSISKERLAELLARARANAAAEKAAQEVAANDALTAKLQSVDEVDTSQLGITNESLKTDAGQDQAVDIIRDIISNISEDSSRVESNATHLPGSAEQNAETAVSVNDNNKQEGASSGKGAVGVARNVTLNEKQQSFADLVKDGKDAVLIGAAGTGKTTSMKQTMLGLLDSGRVGTITEGTKWLQSGAPGIAVVSYTRKAVNNIRKAMPEELKCHTITIHKLLEFAPIYYEIEDNNSPTGFRTTMRFEPTRNIANPLPRSLGAIAFEESSMVSVELHDMLVREACQHRVQTIYLGDIQQLPPIFGLAILGFKMLELPVVELTEVYRQALESPIIDLAWKILEGNPHEFSSKTESFEAFSQVLGKQVKRIRVPALDRFSKENTVGKVVLHPWQKKLSADLALVTATKQFCVWSDQGYFNPDEDIILLPFNKAFGTIELNKGIMQHLGTKRGAEVHEIIAGYNKHYLAAGDRVLYDKEDATIISINRNANYVGKAFQKSSIHLDRWGHLRESLTEEEKQKLQAEEENFDLEAIEKFMEAAAEEAEDRVNAASHVITIRINHSDEEVSLDTAADVNNLLGGYAITVHKAQGSEWEKVFFVMHHTHSVMNQRELLYTAVTRARSFLHVICEVDTFEKGIKSQKIKGNTLAEKAEHFKGKQSEVQKKLDLIAAASKQAVTTISGHAAIRLADLVTPEIDAAVNKKFEECWQLALTHYGEKEQWSKLKKPTISYDLRSKKILGLTKMKSFQIQLNPVWLAIDDAIARKDMIEDTIPHELAHIIAYHIYGDGGHGTYWKMVAYKLGAAPERLCTVPLPPYLESKVSLLEAVFAKHKELTLEMTDEAITDTVEE